MYIKTKNLFAPHNYAIFASANIFQNCTKPRFLLFRVGWRKTTLAYYKDAKNNLSGEKTCQMFMSTIIEVIKDRNNTIKNDVINLEAMDQMYENNTEKMLKEVMPGKSSGK